MPEAFFISLSQIPGDVSWCARSQRSNATALSKACTGSSAFGAGLARGPSVFALFEGTFLAAMSRHSSWALHGDDDAARVAAVLDVSGTGHGGLRFVEVTGGPNQAYGTSVPYDMARADLGDEVPETFL